MNTPLVLLILDGWGVAPPDQGNALALAETPRLRALAEEYRDKGLSVEDAAAIAEKVTRDLSFSAERIAPFEMYIAAGRDHERSVAQAQYTKAAIHPQRPSPLSDHS